MISTRISSASAVLLLLGGLVLLFAPDVVLPRLVPGFPAAGAWLGQLLGAAWLGVAALDWMGRSALLGGIYGRPVVMANTVLYFVAATTLLRQAARGGAPPALWLLALPAALLAGVYLWLLFRGPIERDFRLHRGAQPG